jgi:outer membrane immunogenic protein
MWQICHRLCQPGRITSERLGNPASLGDRSVHKGAPLRKFLLGSVAVAAISVAAETPARAAPPPVYNWTGCYIGGNVGDGWAHKLFTPGNNGPEGEGPARMRSFVGGVQSGCDVQYGMWVFGAQGMFDWASMHGDSPFFFGKQYSTHIPWFATAGGRVGYLVQPTFLIFINGGAAFIRDEHQLVEPPGTIHGVANLTRSGPMIGGGGEWMFAPYWSATVQYGYMSFGTKTVDFQGVGIFSNFNENVGQHAQFVLIGLNYRFNTGGR